MATKQAGQKLLRKLTVRTFIGSKADILAAAMLGRKKDKDGVVIEGVPLGDPVPLMQIIGNATGYRADTSDYGEFIELRGNFRAVNLLTGEILENVTRTILPDVVGDAISSALKGGAEAAQFAVEIDVQYSETAATMYAFAVRTLLPVQVAQPVNALLLQMKEAGIVGTAPLKLAAPQLGEKERKAQAAAEAKADEAKAAKVKGEKATAKA